MAPFDQKANLKLRPSTLSSPLLVSDGTDFSPPYIRTVDSLIIAYAKGKLPCFIGDTQLVMDVVSTHISTLRVTHHHVKQIGVKLIPGDIVVNAMIVTMVYHANHHSQFIYHISSSVRNPVTFSILERCGYRYFDEYARIGKDGKVMKTQKILTFSTMESFRRYMNLSYRMPMEGLCLLNLVLCCFFSQKCKELRQSFDDINLERLGGKMANDNLEANMLSFDPKIIDWAHYFYKIHIPGVMKYVCK